MSWPKRIRVHGIIEPIVVFKEGDRFIGLLGQRRWMAAEFAALDTVPAIVRDAPATEAEAIEIRMIENLARQNLRPMEQAEGLDNFQKANGRSASEVAKRIGCPPRRSPSHGLLQLSEPIRQQIDQAYQSGCRIRTDARCRSTASGGVRSPAGAGTLTRTLWPARSKRSSAHDHTD